MAPIWLSPCRRSSRSRLSSRCFSRSRSSRFPHPYSEWKWNAPQGGVTSHLDDGAALLRTTVSSVTPSPVATNLPIYMTTTGLSTDRDTTHSRRLHHLRRPQSLINLFHPNTSASSKPSERCRFLRMPVIQPRLTQVRENRRGHVLDQID